MDKKILKATTRLMGSLVFGLHLLALAGCAIAPASNGLVRKDNKVDEINYFLHIHKEGDDSFEYKFESDTDCLVIMSVKWPKWRLDDSNYSEATTYYQFDWRAIRSVSYQSTQERRPPTQAESRHSYISLDFFSPQPYKTAALVFGGGNYHGTGFADGLELYVSKDSSAFTQDIINGVLRNESSCVASHGQMNARDIDSYSPEEHYDMGSAYAYSRHPSPKPALAYQSYSKAAQRGHLNAQLWVGNIQRSGLYGVQKDLVAARHWFELAAAQGSPEALNMLGDFYEKGVGGVRVDLTKAAEYYRIAADQGIETAQESLAQMLQFGKGVPKDIAEARSWYRKAEQAGSTSARRALELMEKHE